jgi:hypothetical protein
MARVFLGVFGSLALAVAGVGAAQGAGLGDGTAAFNRHDYRAAARIFTSLAARGDAEAQAMLGFLYSNGRGVTQDYIEAARWYRRASNQGNANAQYMLGLMYDKGHGVPQNYIEAYKWINLAVSGATERERHYWVKIRDAIASKLSSAELRMAQRLALEWRAGRER